MKSYHHEASARVAAAPEQVFEFIDSQARLSSHMSESSWMMGGGRMDIETDSAAGRAVGSTMRLTGSAFGMSLFVEEEITEYVPPERKIWETVGEPELLVIGAYRMGLEMARTGVASTQLRVFIDYHLPRKIPGRWLGWLFAGTYARWCTSRIAAGVATHFASPLRPARCPSPVSPDSVRR